MLFKKYQLILIILASLLFYSVAFAVVVPNINVADVLVKDDSNAALKKALPAAFDQVLIKMSGNPGVATLPAIQNSKNNLNALVQNYSYHRYDNAQGQSQLFVNVTFDKNAVLNLLRQAGQAIWNHDRPQTLVWMTLNNGQNAQVVASADRGEFAKALKQSAWQRGLPVLFPTMDLQDQSFINIDPAKPFDREKLQAVAKRYDVSSILAGDVRQAGPNQWQGQFLLLLNGDPFTWKSESSSSDQAVQAAMSYCANIMANQLAVIDNKALQSSVVLEVLGIQNLNTYMRVTKYIKKLSPVTNVTVKNMSGDSITLVVNTVGGEQELVSTLNQSQLLDATPRPFKQAKTADLYYRWNKTL